ncbi:class 1 isoprenoid biosynthesis enzyme [Streptomyces sp. NRRL B-1347]|uniref:class 1 isoprenoid biosynthesis enzyme n=1 Tax=Streptomyces sp. NRRL B-1347 TaxID=1476877 RepID=UPI0004C78A87|nr:class 1 isoprenoid biosynthesis enzyme [Streptomyces sp. NRRL B-1347]
MDTEFIVPTIASRFPLRLHRHHQEILDDSTHYYQTRLTPLLTGKNDPPNAWYPHCGGDYASFTHPNSLIPNAKAIARYYMIWVILDDIVDNSTTPQEIHTPLDQLTDAVQGKTDHLPSAFQGITDLRNLARSYSPQTLNLFDTTILKWIDVTREMRVAEINRETVSCNQYMNRRGYNAAMPHIFACVACTSPQLACEFEAITGTLAYQEAGHLSGKAIGATMDLYSIVPKHAEVSDHSNVGHIMKRDLGPEATWQDVVDTVTAHIHSYEDDIARHFATIAQTHPLAARALEEAHGGSIMWLHCLRGRRYRDPDVNS